MQNPSLTREWSGCSGLSASETGWRLLSCLAQTVPQTAEDDNLVSVKMKILGQIHRCADGCCRRRNMSASGWGKAAKELFATNVDWAYCSHWVRSARLNDVVPFSPPGYVLAWPRTVEWHSRGRRFDSDWLHQIFEDNQTVTAIQRKSSV